MMGEGFGFSIIIIGFAEDPVHPLASDTVTENVPFATVIIWFVSPLLHR